MTEIKAQVARGDYRVDAHAVADALLARLRTRAAAPRQRAPLRSRVLVPAPALGGRR